MPKLKFRKFKTRVLERSEKAAFKMVSTDKVINKLRKAQSKIDIKQGLSARMSLKIRQKNIRLNKLYKKLQYSSDFVLVPLVNECPKDTETCAFSLDLPDNTDEQDEFANRRRGKSRKNGAILRILIRAYENYDGRWSNEAFQRVIAQTGFTKKQINKWFWDRKRKE